MADGVGSAEPEGVVEGPVDGLGVVASPVEGGEVGVRWWDRADVLGAVELARLVIGVAVESDGDGAAAEVLGESVVVVPAVVPGLVGVAVRADPVEFGEDEFAGVGGLGDADGAGAGEQVDRGGGAVGVGDGAVFDEGGLLDPPAVVAARCPWWRRRLR